MDYQANFIDIDSNYDDCARWFSVTNVEYMLRNLSLRARRYPGDWVFGTMTVMVF